MVAGSFLGLLGITGPNSLDNSSVLLMGLDADVSITDIPEKYQLILCQQAVIELIKEAVFAAFGTETVEIDVCFDGSNEIAGVNSQFSNSQTVIQRQKILLCDIFGTETNRQSFDCTTNLHIGESVCQIQCVCDKFSQSLVVLCAKALCYWDSKSAADTVAKSNYHKVDCSCRSDTGQLINAQTFSYNNSINHTVELLKQHAKQQRNCKA